MRNIPAITKNLLIINGLAFLASLVFNGRAADLNDIGGLHFFMAEDFHLFQFFTYMFLHANFTHILFNMFALWMFGCVIENVWGARKFLFYYIACGVGAGVMQEIAQFFQFYYTMSAANPGFAMGDIFEAGRAFAYELNGWTTIGASGAVYAILLAFGMTFPNERIFIFPLPVPVKAKWFVIFYAAVEMFMALGSSGDGVAHMAHLGGMLFGFFMIRYWNSHPGTNYRNSDARQMFENLKRTFGNNGRNPFGRQGGTRQQTTGTRRNETDREYNARKKARQDEIDRILDKIRTSGYDSLTTEEKNKLFENTDD